MNYNRYSIVCLIDFVIHMMEYASCKFKVGEGVDYLKSRIGFYQSRMEELNSDNNITLHSTEIAELKDIANAYLNALQEDGCSRDTKISPYYVAAVTQARDHLERLSDEG